MKSKKIAFFLLLTLTNFAMQNNPDATKKLQRILYFSIISEVQDQIAQLLKDGADANVIVFPNREETALYVASENDNYHTTVELLLHYGASHQKKNHNNESPISVACINGAIKNVNLLLKAGASIPTSPHVIESLLYNCRTIKLSGRELPSGFIEIVKIILDSQKGIPMHEANGHITYAHTSVLLAHRLVLNEFDSLFRKKIAEAEYSKLNALKRNHHDTYIALLPTELLQEISYMMSNEEFLIQQKGRA